MVEQVDTLVSKTSEAIRVGSNPTSGTTTYFFREIIMDIISKGGYPAGALSNFAPHPFEIDGVACNSMEGFLQSLKFKAPQMQEHVCTLVGKQAKNMGKGKNWQKTQTLYWRGKPYKRDSEEYQELLDRAYHELAKNESFRKALLATRNATLTISPQESPLCEWWDELRNYT